MRKKDIIIIVIVALVVFTPIIINEINEYNLRKLKNEVLTLSKELDTSPKQVKKIKINKSLKINNKKYTTRGTGNAFIYDGGVMIVVSYKNYCAVKIPSINEVVLSKSVCPNYELVKGTIIKTVEKDGLVKNKKNYYYKGQADNYLLFNNELWYILGFENNKIKIIKESPVIKIEQNKVIDYLNNEFYNSLDKSKIDDYSYDASSIDITDKINITVSKKNKLHIGLLSIFDYMKTLNEECKTKKNALICGQSFITKSMWLSNNNEDNSAYLYDDGNIYIGDLNLKKDIYPVLYLKENTEITSGYGTKNAPYRID